MKKTANIYVANGRFRLIRKIGVGGMATVFLAYDESLDIERAIKILSPKMGASKSASDRFVREAKLMASLNHPNITAVTDTLRSYPSSLIVMEYLKGGALNDYVKLNGPFSTGHAAKLMIDVCLGIQFAHDANIIHRDIKPHNILLSEFGSAKVSDFGIARRKTEDSTTKTGVILGTTSYMSPEQSLSANRVTEQSDIYSIGATFFAILSGLKPFELYREDVRDRMLLKVPENVRETIKRCCLFNPEERFQSSLELKEALEELRTEDDDEFNVILRPPTTDLEADLEDVWNKFVSSITQVPATSEITYKHFVLEVEEDSLDLELRTNKEGEGAEPETELMDTTPEITKLKTPIFDERSQINKEADPNKTSRVGFQGPNQPSIKLDKIKAQSPSSSQIRESSKTSKPPIRKHTLGFGIGLIALSVGVAVASQVMSIHPSLKIPTMLIPTLLSVSIFSGLLMGKGELQNRSVLGEVFALAMAGCFMASFGAFWIAPQLLELPFFETDFIDYCVGIQRFDSALLAPSKRSVFATWLPAVFARNSGVLNGLAMGALVSTSVIAASIYGWARVVGGHTAGYFALVLALSFAPIVGLSRFLNFYPEIIAVFCLAAALNALAIKSRHWGAILLAGSGVGMCLLVDVRGLIWAIPLGFGLVIAVIGLPTWKERLGSVLGLVGILAAFWRLGRWSFHELSTPLERQIDVRPLFAAFDPSAFPPPYSTASEFIWGRSALSEIPQTLLFLWEQRKITPPEEFLSSETGMTLLQPYAQGLGLCLIFCLLVCVGMKYKFKWRLMALLIPLIPFVIALIGTQELVEPHLRFFSHALPAVVVVLGVFMATVSRAFWVSSEARSTKWRMATLFGVGVILLGLMTPTVVDWHPQWPIQRHIYISVMKKAFPERAGYFRTLRGSVGREIHVNVLPLTQAERAMASGWDIECAGQLKIDGVLSPEMYSKTRVP